MTGSAGVHGGGGGGGGGAHAHQSWKVGTFVEFYLRRHLLCVNCACAGEPDPKSHPAPVQSTRFSSTVVQKGQRVPAGGHVPCHSD